MTLIALMKKNDKTLGPILGSRNGLKCTEMDASFKIFLGEGEASQALGCFSTSWASPPP